MSITPVPALLEQKKFLESRFFDLNLRLSEYNFTNLFCFEEVHQFHFNQKEPHSITGRTYDGFSYTMPLVKPGSPKMWPHYPIPDEWLSLYPEELFHREHRREDSDYLHKREKLALLPGRKLASKRNLLYQIERDFELSMVPIVKGDSSLIDKAIDLLKKWHRIEDPTDPKDFHACMRALQYLPDLSCEGFIFMEGEKAYGFVIGEKLSQDTYVVHFEKSTREIHGLDTWMFSHLARRLDDTIQWINLEQDLGLADLRHSKEAFKPDLLLPKWRLFPRADIEPLSSTYISL